MIYKTLFPWITRSMTAMMAIRSKMCIIAPALKAKKPIAQKMTRTTAMVYSKFPMILTI